MDLILLFYKLLKLSVSYEWDIMFAFFCLFVLSYSHETNPLFTSKFKFSES